MLTAEERESYQGAIEDANAGFTFTPGHLYSTYSGSGPPTFTSIAKRELSSPRSLLNH